MKVNVKGEHVSDKIINMYVSELVKAHPDKHIDAVDIFVEGDKMKVRLMHDLDRSAWNASGEEIPPEDEEENNTEIESVK